MSNGKRDGAAVRLRGWPAIRLLQVRAAPLPGTVLRVTEQSSEAWQRYLASLPPLLAALHAQAPADVLTAPDGQTVTADDLLAVLREQVAEPAGVVERAVRKDRHGPGLLAAAWRHVGYQQARAVTALFDAGLAVEAQANARACIEHAVLLQRLAAAADNDQTGRLLLQLTYEQQKRQGRKLDYVEELDAASGGRHQALLAEARRQHDAHQVPEDRSRPQVRTAFSHFSELPGGIHFYSVYSRLSENTHAGLSSAVAYLLPALQADKPVSPHAAPADWAEVLAMVCWSCWAADDALRRFLVDGEGIAARHVPLMAKVGLATG